MTYVKALPAKVERPGVLRLRRLFRSQFKQSLLLSRTILRTQSSDHARSRLGGYGTADRTYPRLYDHTITDQIITVRASAHRQVCRML
jgi:hypothetical protein